MKWLTIVAMAFVVAVLASGAGAEEKQDKDKGKKMSRVFELRIYHAAPGKMKALHARFREHTNKLFVKHGMTLIGFWSPTDEKQADKLLYYILAYPSKEAGEKSWEAFRKDPDWIKAKDASEKEGKLVDKVESIWLNPTDYSPMK
jgi:hypothetical protein